MNTDNRWQDELEEEKDIKEIKSSENLRTILLNYERNVKVLTDAVYERVGDLMLCLCLNSQISNGVSIVITPTIERCGLNADTVMSQAKAATAQHMTLTPLLEVLCGLSAEIEGDSISDTSFQNVAQQDCPLWVLTTDDNIYGSALMGDMEVLQKIYHKFNEDFYILPSSIYEVLIMPVSGCKNILPEELRELVKDINHTTVAISDQLSDNIYKFDGKQITVID